MAGRSREPSLCCQGGGHPPLYFFPTASASCCACCSALSMVVVPAIAAANCSPQPGRPRRQIPEIPLLGLFTLWAAAATSSQVGLVDRFTPACESMSFRYIRKDDSA